MIGSRSFDLPLHHPSTTPPRKTNRATSASWKTCSEPRIIPRKPGRNSSNENDPCSGPYPSGAGSIPGEGPRVTFDLSLAPKKPGCWSFGISEGASRGTVRRQRRQRKSGTSQGTTIVHERTTNLSTANLPQTIGEVLSRPSNRKQNFFSEYQTQPPQQLQPGVERSTITIDDLRRQGETRFYEQAGAQPGGPVRRSSMIRTVSKEDYLLARGANPRTGLVTPGCHSASASFDETEVLKAREAAASAKWRQKGNEWITLQPGQATPLATPPYAAGLSNSRGLRTPPKLNAAAQRHTASFDHATHRPSRIGPSPLARAVGDDTTPLGVPGTYPRTPSKDYFGANPIQEVRTDSVIRRKPVGNPKTGIVVPTHHTEVVKTWPDTNTAHAGDELRSSSAPAPVPRGIGISTTGGNGKNLPALPGVGDRATTTGTRGQQQGSSFLGQPKPLHPAPEHGFRHLNTSGQARCDKDLPCPPTSSGLYPSAPYLTVSKEQHAEGHHRLMNKAQPSFGPRAWNPAIPHGRITKMCVRDQDVQRRGPKGSRSMPIPQCDNQLKFRPEPLQRPKIVTVEGPRKMPQRQPVDVPFAEDVFTTSPTDIIIDTPIFTNTFTPPQTHQISPITPRSLPPRMPSDQYSPQISPQKIVRAPKPWSTNMNTGTNDMVSMPLPRIRPRGMTRPMMPLREGGMYDVYQASPLRNRSNAGGMAHLRQWTMTGMQANSDGSDGSDVGPDLIPLPLRPRIPDMYKRRPAMPVQQEVTRTNGLGLIRKCSRCHSGFVDGQPHNINGATRPSEHCAASILPDCSEEGQIEPFPTLSAVSGTTGNEIEPKTSRVFARHDQKDVNTDDERDHSICCPECCKEADCHEGCLGHPSPAHIPKLRLYTRREKVSSPHEPNISPMSVDTTSSTSDKGRPGTLAAIRSAFRKSFTRERPDKIGDTTNPVYGEVDPTTDPRTEPVELSALPLSPATFCGVDGVGGVFGAIEAAKCAMGFKTDNHADSAVSPQDKMDVSANKPSVSFGDAFRPPSSNESRRLANPSGHRLPTPAGTTIFTAYSAGPRSRNVSCASAATIEIQVPGLGSLGIGALWEMAMVPFAASRMWLRNHPQVLALGWIALERGWEMGQVMTTTGARIWRIVFVYSKTGKLRFKADQGPAGFLVDCARSGLYLLIFLGVGMCFVRVLRVAFGLLGLVGMVISGLFWIVKKLMGHGLVW